MNTFDDVWLSKYTGPEYIGFDNGGEYKNVFEELVNNYGIKKKNRRPFNPQSNGIIERVHLTLNDSLRTAEIDGRLMDDIHGDHFWPLLHIQYAAHSTPHEKQHQDNWCLVETWYCP
jgi:transposase InsO family protein